MKKLCLGLGLLGLVGACSAQVTPPNWSGSIYYDIRSKVANAVVYNRIGDLTLKGKIVAEAVGFVGLSNQKATPGVIGFAVIWRKPLFDQVSLVFGPAGSLTAGKWGGGFTAGLSVKF